MGYGFFMLTEVILMVPFANAILARIMSVFVRGPIQFYACICYIAVAALYSGGYHKMPVL